MVAGKNTSEIEFLTQRFEELMEKMEKETIFEDMERLTEMIVLKIIGVTLTLLFVERLEKQRKHSITSQAA